MLPLLCLLPTVLRRLKPAATCLLFTIYCLLFPATPVFSEIMGWAATYGGEGWDVAESVQQTREAGYIVAVFKTFFGAGKDDVWVVKLGSDGAVEWQKTYGWSSSDWANSVQQTSDGGYIVAGKG